MLRSALLFLSLAFIAVTAGESTMAPSNTDPPRPQIPASYSTNCTVRANINGALKNMNGTMEVDDENETFLMNITADLFTDGQTTNTKKYPLNVQRYCKGKNGNSTLNGQCRPPNFPGSCYSSYFRFMPYAKYFGVSTLEDGARCNMWVGNFPNVVLSVCVSLTDANLPLYFRILNYNSITRISTPTSFRYWTFTGRTSADEPVILPPPSCAVTPYSCAKGPVEHKTMWRLHSPADYSLVNKNVADLTGDAVFLCIFVNENNTDFLSNSLFSAFNTTVNTTWSQYSLCNADPKNASAGYSCVGAEGQPHQVGREAAFAAAPKSGQCTPEDPDIGVWYSFPASAEGPSGWQELARIKSINASCMLSDELRTACRSFPFSNAVKVIEKAFASCSDVPPPSSRPSRLSHSEQENTLDSAHWSKLIERHLAEQLDVSLSRL